MKYVKWLVVGYVALVIAGCEVEESGSSGSSDSESAAKDGGGRGFEATDDHTPKMGVGKTVKVDGVRYKILSADTAKSIGDEYVGETADGQFLVLRIRARNDRKKSSTLTDSVMAIEANGNTYEPDSEGTFAFELSRGGDQNEDSFFLRDIQPGTATKGYVVFDLPRKVLNKQDLSVRFNELGFGSTHGYLAVPPR